MSDSKTSQKSGEDATGPMTAARELPSKHGQKLLDLASGNQTSHLKIHDF